MHLKKRSIATLWTWDFFSSCGLSTAQAEEAGTSPVGRRGRGWPAEVGCPCSMGSKSIWTWETCQVSTCCISGPLTLSLQHIIIITYKDFALASQASFTSCDFSRICWLNWAEDATSGTPGLVRNLNGPGYKQKALICCIHGGLIIIMKIKCELKSYIIMAVLYPAQTEVPQSHSQISNRLSLDNLIRPFSQIII